MAIDILGLSFKVDTAPLKTLQRELDNVSKGASKVADNIDAATTKTAKASKETNALAGNIKSLAAAYVGFAGVSRLTQTIDDYARFTAQLKNATKSQLEYAAAYENTIRIAQKAQVDVAAVGGTYARLTRSLSDLGASQTQVGNIAETVALALKVSGASAAESASAMLQLSQAFGAGALMGDEFRSMAEGAPVLMKALADSMGVPVGALKKMAGEGQLTASIMANAFKDPALLAALRAQAENIVTISGSYQQFKNQLTISIGEMDKATGFSHALAVGIKAIAENVDILLPLLAGLATALIGISGATILRGIATLAGGLSSLVGIIASPVGLVAALVAAGTAFLMFQNKASKGLDEIKAKAALLNEELKKTTPSSQYEELSKRQVQIDKDRNDLLEKRKTLISQISNLEAAGGSFAGLAAAKKAELESTNQLIQAANVLLTENVSKIYEVANAGNAIAATKLTWAQLTAELKLTSVAQAEYAKTSAQIAEAGKAEGKTVAQIAEAQKALADKLGLTKKAKIEDNDAAKELADTYSALAKAIVEANNPMQSQAEKLQQMLDKISEIDPAFKSWAQAEIDYARDRQYLDSLNERVDAYNSVIDGLRDAIAQQEAENEVLAKTANSVAEVTIRRLEERKAMLASIGASQDVLDQLQKEIDLRRELEGSVNRGKAYEEAKKVNDEAVKAAKEANDEIKKANDKMAEDLNRALTDSIMRGFESGKSFAKNFRDSLINYFKTLVLRPIISFIVDSSGITKVLGSVLGGISGTSAAGTAATAASSVGTIETLFSGAKSIYDTITNGFQSAQNVFAESIANFGTFIEGFSNSVDNGLAFQVGRWINVNSEFISEVLPYAGSVVKLLQGDITGAATTAIGTAIGNAIMPGIGGVIGGALGSFVGGLFGGGKKLPRYYTVLPSTYKEGTFKAGTPTTGSDSKGLLKGAADPLTSLSKAFATSLGTVLNAFGKDADITMKALLYKKNNTIGRFEATIGGKTYKIDFDGGEDVNATFKKLVKETFTKVFVEALKGQDLGANINNLFTGLKTQDEVVKMADALVNLANAQTGLSDKFGITADQTAKLALAMSSTTEETTAYINAMATLGAEVKTVGQSIMDMKQKLIDAFNAVLDTNHALATFPTTVDEYDALLKEVNKTTDDGIALFGELLKLRGDFVLFTNAINELKGSVNTSIYSLLSPTEQLAQLQIELADVFASINRKVPTSVAELIALGKSIDYTSEAGLTLASQFPKLVSAFSAVKQAAEQVLAEAKQNLIAAFDAERERLQGIIDNAKTAEQKLRDAFSAKSLNLTDTINKFKAFGNSIKEFRQSLGESVATTESPLAAARRRFDTVAAGALAGNEDSLNNIQSASTDYLNAFELYSTDFVSYMRAFAYVSDTLSNVETSAYKQADSAQTQLDTLKIQVSKLISIDETNQSIESIMTEVKVAQDASVAAQGLLTALNAQQVSLLGTINGSVLSVADAIKQYNAAKTAAEAVAATTTDKETITSGIVQRTDLSTVDKGTLVGFLKSATGSSTYSEAYADVKAQYGSVTTANVEKFLRTNYSTLYYANGGVFSNGIVDRPTAFNVGVMGEAGAEAIMPLTNIGGKLGVSTNNTEMVRQLSVISEKISRLEAAAISTAQHTGKVARVIDRSDNGDSINVTVLA